MTTSYLPLDLVYSTTIPTLRRNFNNLTHYLALAGSRQGPEIGSIRRCSGQVWLGLNWLCFPAAWEGSFIRKSLSEMTVHQFGLLVIGFVSHFLFNHSPSAIRYATYYIRDWLCFPGLLKRDFLRNALLYLRLRPLGLFANWLCFASYVGHRERIEGRVRLRFRV